MRQTKRALPSLFLIALSVLMIEVCLTRIFSVLSWHHFAYLIISLALLGFGAAGSYLTVSRRFADEGIDATRLSHFAWLFALTLIGAVILASKIRFYPLDVVLLRDYSNVVSLLILYVIVGIPFFFAGVCIGRMVALAGDRVNLFYFADLTGAGVGALVSLVVINRLGAVSGVFLGATLAALAACILGGGEVVWRRWAYRLTLVLSMGLMVLTAITDALPFYYPPSKSLFRKEQQVEYSRWHVIGKIDITHPMKGYASFGGALSQRHRKTPPTVRGIYQDGAAPTGIMHVTGAPEAYEILGEYLQGIPYVVQPAESVLVIGIGGGIDGLIALHYGVQNVVGIDVNPVTVDAVERLFRKECPALWADGRFKIQVSEGRHYLTYRRERFDVIQLSGVDTYTALSVGAYVLSENFLYTKEAMQDYWRHLTDDGILSFSRWLFDPPRETLRLVTTQLAMLDGQGVRNAANNLFIVSGTSCPGCPPWAEVMMKRSPFTTEQVNRLLSWAGDRDFDVLYDPFRKRSNVFDEFIRADLLMRENLIDKYHYNVSPTSDDDPFFFQFYRWRSLYDYFGGTSKQGTGGYYITRRPLGLLILAVSMFQMVLLSFLFIIGPLWMRHRLRSRRPGRAGVFLYFAALGFGFIFIEIALLQKFSVFVGGPVYSMAITLAAILVFSGLGSLFARSFHKRPMRWLIVVIVALVIFTALEMSFLNTVMNHLMGLSHTMRCLVTVLVLAPLALLMGMPFPTGLRILQQVDESMRPWAWGVNACATVIGSMLCVLLSIHAGFTIVMFTAAIIYVFGGLAMGWAVYRES